MAQSRSHLPRTGEGTPRGGYRLCDGRHPVTTMSAAIRKALVRPENGVRLRLRRFCYRLRKPHYVFTTREAADNALFTWGMAMRDRGSRTHNLLTVFGCGDHWHIGRNR